MKTVTMLTALLLSTGISAQNAFPTDWSLDGLKGKPKELTIDTYLPDKDLNIRYKYYFNNRGYLQKMEDYGDFYDDIDSLVHIESTYYLYAGMNRRMSITVREDKGDTVRISQYEHTDLNTLIEYTDVFDTYYVVEGIISLDEMGRRKMIEMSFYDRYHDTVRTRSFEYLTYDKDGYMRRKKIVDDTTGRYGKLVSYEDVEYDRLGNVIFLHHKNDDGKVESIEKRTFIYYEE